MCDSNSTKICSRLTCKRTLPLSATSKTCDTCRELNNQSQKSRRLKLKEVSTGANNTAAGTKRKLHQGQDSDRPPHRHKTQEEAGCDGETEDEDEFDIGGIGFMELDDKVSNKA